ncbi:MAG: RNA methyltransferase [Lachnospiraceae bacterium]|nr:RNA methyltransferase [Lachnospiraceae bacterium]
MITSVTNPRLKNITKLLSLSKERRKQGLYVIEGPKLFLEAFEAVPESLGEVYISESFSERLEGQDMFSGPQQEKLRSALLKTGYETVSDAVFKKLSDTKTPQGIVCVVRGAEISFEPERSKEELFSKEKDLLSGDGSSVTGQVRSFRCLLLEGIQDPGNFGTMIRTAEAAGFDLIVADHGTADLYNPKTIRSTMGSVFRMRVAYAADFPGAISFLKEKGVTVYAAHLLGENFYDEEEYAEKTAILIGNEGKGLSAEVSALADRLVRIPMQGKTESLNAAVAAALLMFQSRYILANAINCRF